MTDLPGLDRARDGIRAVVTTAKSLTCLSSATAAPRSPRSTYAWNAAAAGWRRRRPGGDGADRRPDGRQTPYVNRFTWQVSEEETALPEAEFAAERRGDTAPVER